MATITFENVLVTVCCCECGIQYGVPQHWKHSRAQDHGTFYCPNGHQQYIPAETEAETLRKQLAATRAKLDQKEMAVREAIASAERSERRSARAEKEAKKIRRRAEAALCPCCNRQFVQLRRHMKSKHPEVAHASFEKHKKPTK